MLIYMYISAGYVSLKYVDRNCRQRVFILGDVILQKLDAIC